MTWDAFVKSIEANVGGRYVRQTLDRHVRIKEAYQQAKERVSGSKPGGEEGKLTSKEVARRLADYDRLKNEVARLERENNNYAKHRHVRIKEAYQLAKSRSGEEIKPSEHMTAKEMKRKLADYDRLKNEVERLERENNNYAKQFARWVWNLRQMKITEDQLSRLDTNLP